MERKIDLEDFDPVVAEVQIQTLTVDFGDFLPEGVALQGVPVVDVTAVSGGEDIDEDIIDDGPAIGTLSEDDGGSGVVNAAVIFRIKALQRESMYLFVYSCEADNGDTVAAFNHIRAVTPK